MNIRALAREEYGVEIDQSLQTLDVLQRIMDGDLVNDNGVSAVAVVPGRIMVTNIAGLDW